MIGIKYKLLLKNLLVIGILSIELNSILKTQSKILTLYHYHYKILLHYQKSIA
jgi:hypothetical protein